MKTDNPFIALAEAIAEANKPLFVYRSGTCIYGPDLVDAIPFGQRVAANLARKQ
jgi:hypothetical protein